MRELTLTVKHGTDEISVMQMEDGDLAVVTKWGSRTSIYIGRVVQRYGAQLIQVGHPEIRGWPNIFDKNHPHAEEFRTKCNVRLLRPGDSITIQ